MLIFTCFIPPWHICFTDDHQGWYVVNILIDCLFGVDMFVIFNSAYQTEDFEIVDDHKSIAISYITGWFWLDLIAIIPFQDLFGADENLE